MKFNRKVLVFTAFLNGVGLTLGWAADTSGTINTPNNDSYSTAPGVDASPAPKTTRHRHASRKSSKPKPSQTAIPADPASAQGAPPTKDTVVPGISGSNQGNDAGKSNMGSGDHVPGTTGTSGQ